MFIKILSISNFPGGYGYNHLPHLPPLWTETGSSGTYTLGDMNRGCEVHGKDLV